MSTTEATEPALVCELCGWVCFPLREGEGHLLGLGDDVFTTELGWLIAHACATVHEAFRHPATFSAHNDGRNVEEAVATIQSDLAPLGGLYERIKYIAIEAGNP